MKNTPIETDTDISSMWSTNLTNIWAKALNNQNEVEYYTLVLGMNFQLTKVANVATNLAIKTTHVPIIWA